MPGLLGVSILFWSWSVELWPLGLMLAALLEAPRWMPWRFQLKEKVLVRIFKLFLFLVTAVFILLLVVQLNEGIYTFAQWFPLLVVPIIVMQLYHEQERFPIQLLVNSFVNRPSYPSASLSKTIDLRLLYVFVTLIATSIAAPNEVWVFLSFGIIMALSLWHARPRNFHSLQWFTLASLAFLLAFFIKGGLADLQTAMQEITTDWLMNDWSQTNVFQSYTAIGQIGELKLSNKILMRIRASNQRSLLLQQASYSTYVSGTWHMQHLIFQDLTKKPNTNTWLLSQQAPHAKQQLSVSSSLKKGQGILALPKGSYAIHNERPGKLSKNSNGSVRIKKAPELLDYTVDYSNVVDENSKPGQVDLRIPDSYRELLDKAVAEIGLMQLPPQDATKKLESYFEVNFRYSLVQKDRDNRTNALEFFLNSSRKGHCEHYATAGALILRAIGIPTRYVTGYSMSEFDMNTQRYLVRQRHAHAWTLAYIDKQWVELDFTPSTWAALEAAQDPWWQGIHDFISNKIADLQRWWESDTGEVLRVSLFTVVIFLLIYFGKRLKLGRLNFTWQKKFYNQKQPANSKLDSPFYKIINHLEKTIDRRKPEETIRNWLKRIEKQLGPNKSRLAPLLKKHYEIVYGESPYTTQSLGQFALDVQHWLADENNNKMR